MRHKPVFSRYFSSLLSFSGIPATIIGGLAEDRIPMSVSKGNREAKPPFSPLAAAIFAREMHSMSHDPITPELILCADDGVFPNSAYPALIFRRVFAGLAPEVIEKKLDDHGWCNSWRNGILDSDHYHSNTHEVLAVYEGRAELLVGGPKLGKKATIAAGDVVIIPAGVAHHNLGSSEDFKCIGAYPNGAVYDLNYGEDGERPGADEQIRVVPFPHNDPVSGDGELLKTYWKAPVSA